MTFAIGPGAASAAGIALERLAVPLPAAEPAVAPAPALAAIVASTASPPVASAASVASGAAVATALSPALDRRLAELAIAVEIGRAEEAAPSSVRVAAAAAAPTSPASPGTSPPWIALRAPFAGRGPDTEDSRTLALALRDEVRARLAAFAPGTERPVATPPGGSEPPTTPPNPSMPAAELHSAMPASALTTAAATAAAAAAAHVIDIRIDPDDERAQGYEDAPAPTRAWIATVRFELPTLGTVVAAIRVAGQAVAARFECTQPAPLRDALPELAARMTEAGLQPIALAARE